MRSTGQNRTGQGRGLFSENRKATGRDKTGSILNGMEYDGIMILSHPPFDPVELLIADSSSLTAFHITAAISFSLAISMLDSRTFTPRLLGTSASVLHEKPLVIPNP